MEQVVYEPGSGQVLSASFMDYCMPRADTLCDIRIRSNPVPTDSNPLGAKGAGEGGRMLTPAIVSAAIEDALEPYGVRITSLPITAEQIVEWASSR